MEQGWRSAQQPCSAWGTPTGFPVILEDVNLVLHNPCGSQYFLPVLSKKHWPMEAVVETAGKGWEVGEGAGMGFSLC